MKKALLFPSKNLFLLTILCFFLSCKKKSNSYNLDISIKNNGTVNYDSGKQPIGEIIKLQATPEDGFEFIEFHKLVISYFIIHSLIFNLALSAS